MKKTNLSYILFALNQCKEARDYGFTLNECRRNLDTALHQYWQANEMGLHGTARRHLIQKSFAARISDSKCEVEHAVPRSVIINLLLDIANPTEGKIRHCLEKYYRVCLVTKGEHENLSKLKLRSKMPDNWDRKDPYARYKVAGIRVDGGWT